MGVVRREGNWRLEKHQDGVYEVTYQNQSELKILTDDYEPTGFDNEHNDFTTPIREVQSFSEAENIFHEMAENGSSSGFSTQSMGISQVSSGEIDTSLGSVTDEDTPPLPLGGLLLVAIVAGGFAIQQGGFDPSSPVTLLGIGLLGVGVIVLGQTYLVYASDGARAAVKYLTTVDKEETQTSESESANETEKTPPAPNHMKEDIYFERADQECEWCGERTDSPEVHHIEPRSEGGANDYDNLIALCPKCHRKADKGGISKTKLRGKVSRQSDQWEKEV